MPASVDSLVIVLADSGVPVSPSRCAGATQQAPGRIDGKFQRFHVANSRIDNPPPRLPASDARFPRFSAKLAPYLDPSYFDPDEPVHADFDLGLSATAEPFRGMVLSGALRQSLFGNLSDSTRVSDSPLPHVRSDGASYDREGETALSTLTAA